MGDHDCDKLYDLMCGSSSVIAQKIQRSVDCVSACDAIISCYSLCATVNL